MKDFERKTVHLKKYKRHSFCEKEFCHLLLSYIALGLQKMLYIYTTG